MFYETLRNCFYLIIDVVLKMLTSIFTATFKDTY